MRTRSSQTGFSLVEITLAAAVVIIIGALGYVFYTNYQNSQTKADEASQATDTSEAPAITNASDLDTATKALDDSDLESNSSDDLSNIDKDLSAF
jgi:type II secretory pathway pseudopilin PulG